MAKIAESDRNALNRLYKREVAKFARYKKAGKDDTQDPDAFRDHEEYIKTVESVLKADKAKPAFPPNDPLKD